MLERLRQEDFARNRDTEFGARPHGRRPVTLRLIELRPYQAAAGVPEGYECFSLLFHGPASDFLEQGTYPMEHADLGAFELFITPIARGQDHFEYEAVFNRRIPAGGQEEAS